MESHVSGGPRELVDVLMTLGRLRRTGILTVQGDDQIIGLTFLEGKIVGTDALHESLEEGLGQILAERQLVTVGDFASLVAEYDAGGGRVTDLLLERGFVDRDQLMDALRWQCYLICLQVLSWEAFEHKFYAGSEVAYEDGVEPLPVEELLVRAAQDLAPEGPLPGAMPIAEWVFQKTDSVVSEVGRDELLIGLATEGDEATESLLRETDGVRSVGELAAVVGTTEFEARLSYYLLERGGRVSVADTLSHQSLTGSESRGTPRFGGLAKIKDKLKSRFSETSKASARESTPISPPAPTATPAPEPKPTPIPAPPPAPLPEPFPDATPLPAPPPEPRPPVIPARDPLPPTPDPIPAPDPAPVPIPAHGSVRVSGIEWNVWSARALGVGMFVILIAFAMSDRTRFLVPFPWQDGLRQSVLDEQTSAAYLKIDRAAKTSFLLAGHFPERLETLVEDSYVTPRDLIDPAGRRLGYASQVAGYLIYPEGETHVAPGASRTETITGNFLLDPEFVPEQSVDSPPLVLLD